MELDEWFRDNYDVLGFSKILSTTRVGDYIGWRNDKKYRIELEQTTSQFFLHTEKMRKKIDIIICWRKSRSRLEWKQEELSRKEIIEVAHLLKPTETALYRSLHGLVSIEKMGESLAPKRLG